MLILDNVNKSLRVRLASVHTTNPLKCVASWRDVGDDSFLPGNTLSQTNGTTGVEIVPATTSTKQRVIDYVNVLNTDTVTHTVTFYIYDGSTNFDIATITIGVNERVEFTDTGGFSCFNAAGALKTLVTATQNVKDSGFSMVVLGSDVVNSNATANTMADITGLSFPVVANTRYWFEFFIWWTSASTSTGARFSVNGPASPTTIVYRSDWSLTSTTRTINEAVSYDIPAAASASVINPSGNLARIEGFVVPSADGNLVGRFASEISSSAITAKAGSYLRYLAVT